MRHFTVEFEKVENIVSGEFNNIVVLNGERTSLKFSNILFSDLRIVLSDKESLEELIEIITIELTKIVQDISKEEVDLIMSKMKFEELPELYIGYLRKMYLELSK